MMFDSQMELRVERHDEMPCHLLSAITYVAFVLYKIVCANPNIAGILRTQIARPRGKPETGNRRNTLQKSEGGKYLIGTP
jgi:hypothetical protein